MSKSGFLQYSSADLDGYTITGDINLDSVSIQDGNERLNCVTVAFAESGLAAGSLALNVQVSHDNSHWVDLTDVDTLTLTSSVTSGTIDFVTNFKYFRVQVDDTGAESPTLTGMYTARRVDTVQKITVDMASGGFTNITASGSATVGGVLSVAGASTFTGAVNIVSGFTASSGTVTGLMACSSVVTIASSCTVGHLLACSSALSVASSATISGTVACSTDVAIEGAITNSSFFKLPMVAASSSVTLPGYGIVTLGSTKDTQFTLVNPTSRTFLHIISTSSYNKTVVCASSADCCFGDASSSYKLNFDAVGEAVLLVGKSTAAWAIVSNNGSVALITT